MDTPDASAARAWLTRRARGLALLLPALLCAWALTPAPAFAQESVPLSATGPASYPAPLRVLAGLPESTTVGDVAALPPQRFAPFVPAKLYPVGRHSPLWLQLRVTAPTALGQSDWLLEFPTVIVDRYEVYQQDAQGRWQMALAGDRVAHHDWPVDSLRPRFPLVAAGPGEHTVYVRVVHELPVNLQPLIERTSTALERDRGQLLWTGLLLGVILALVLTCAQMSLAYRDTTYAWYAGYLLSTLVAALCYSGLAQRSLWPGATKYSSDAIVVAVMVAFAFNLQFSRAMFGGSLGRVFHGLARLLMLLCLTYAAQTLLSQHYDYAITSFNVLSVSVFVLIISGALLAWRRGVGFAGYWLMVYAPYLGCIALTLFESVGLVALPWLPAETPVAAALFEAVAMMLCLNAYSRLRHAQFVREQVAARHDPLTGFLKPVQFRQQAARLWAAAAASRRDAAVVYLQVESASPDPEASKDTEALVARSVRLVRTVSRGFDTVGRLGRNRVGIFLASMPPGEGLSNRLARLIALGLMHDPEDPQALALRFRVAVGHRRHQGADFSALDTALHALLDADSPHQRSIRTLPVQVPVARKGQP